MYLRTIFIPVILTVQTTAKSQIRGDIYNSDIFIPDNSKSVQQSLCTDPFGFCENISNFLCNNISFLQRLCPNRCSIALISLPDSELLDMLTGGNTIGEYCRIEGPSTGTACEYYVKGTTSTATGYDGVPRNTEDKGTGCVHPGSGDCYYDGVEYDLTPQEREDMCTSNTRANAAAQLRHGIANGYCGCF